MCARVGVRGWYTICIGTFACAACVIHELNATKKIYNTALARVFFFFSIFKIYAALHAFLHLLLYSSFGGGTRVVTSVRLTKAKDLSLARQKIWC